MIYSFSAIRVGRSAIALMLAATSILFASYTMFGGFRPWDDEGYMMTTVQHVLDGHPLYGDASVPYGPFYYSIRWVIHGVLRVPLCNDAVRITSIVAWILSAALFAITIYRIWRNSPLSIALVSVCFVACTLHLHAISFEPGHPQETIVLLLAIGLFASSYFNRRKADLITFILGCCSAAMLLTKINVGVFFLLAVLLAMLAPKPTGWPLRILRYLVLISALVVPLALLKSHLHEAWAQKFCASVTVSLLSCWIVGARETLGDALRPRQFVTFGFGLLTVTILCVGFVMFHGGSPGGMLNSILLKALRFPAIFGWPLATNTLHVCMVFAGGIVAGLYLLPQPARRRAFIDEVGLPSLKLLTGLSILCQACGFHFSHPPVSQSWPFSFAAGFFWLVLFVPAGRQALSHELFLRRLIAYTACLQTLQIYPVPGNSQFHIGTITVLPLAAVLIGDAGSVFAAFVTNRLPRTGVVWLRSGARGLSLLVLCLLLARIRTARISYYSVDEVHLAGCHLTKMPEDQATAYRFLSETIRASADTFVCKCGFNSLYFWSQTRPASTVTISHAWQLFDAAQQNLLLSANQAIPRLIFIDHPGFVDESRVFPIEKREIPFLTFVQQEMQPRVRVGPYKLYTRGDRGEMKLRSCAYKLSTGTIIPASRIHSAAPIPRISGEHFECTFLHISLPDDLAGRQVTRVELVDLYGQALLCRTSSREASKLAVLLGQQEQILLPNHPEITTVPSDQEEWTLAIPASIDLGGLGFPAIRFYDDVAKRRFTVPVAVALSAGD